MSLQEETQRALARLRRAGTDLYDVEVKAAAGGLPRSAIETLAAFANADGGLLLLGLDESAGFTAVPVDAAKLATDLASACADQLEPPVRAEIDIVAVDGQAIVAAVVVPLPPARRPCFVKARGMDRGAFLRTHDGDRALTTYEVHVMLSSRGQPLDDKVPVEAASPADLDSTLVASLVQRLRSTRGPIFREVSDDDILRMLDVITDGPEEEPVPTVGGLLALGRYPQRFFPQLNTTFVAFPTVTGEPMADGTRFLDNVSIEGAIPVQVNLAMEAVRRNMRRRAIVAGLGREDRWEYPEGAIREAIANALIHRDYHPLAHGTQVRIEMYPDRLVVSNPGGLHGPVSTQDLLAEPVTSSRNALLAKLLEDVEAPGTGRTVCENRGSGLLAMAAALRRAGMEPPDLKDTVREFKVVFHSHGLVDDESVAWLSALDLAGTTDRQRLGLAFLRRHGQITNQQYRTLTGCDAATGTRELGALAMRGLTVRSSSGRATVWLMSEVFERSQAPLRETEISPATAEGRDRRAHIRQLLRERPRSAGDLASALQLSRPAVMRWLNLMEAEGEIEGTESKRRSPTHRWRLTGKPPSPG